MRLPGDSFASWSDLISRPKVRRGYTKAKKDEPEQFHKGAAHEVSALTSCAAPCFHHVRRLRSFLCSLMPRHHAAAGEPTKRQASGAQIRRGESGYFQARARQLTPSACRPCGPAH